MQIESDVPILEEPKRGRGRPPGSKNKPKFVFHEPKLTPDLPTIDSRKVEQGVIKELKKRGRPPKWAQKEPKEPKFTIIGAINKGAAKLAAVEWEPVRDTPEQKAKLAKQQEEGKEWTQICLNLDCNHSKMAHKTVGNGACMIQGCDCKGGHF